MTPSAADTPRRGALVRAGTAAGALGAEGAAAWLHPALGAALAITDIAIPAIFALTLLAAILLGSAETCERAFRLLRWLAGRPEPSAPAAAPRKTSHARRQRLRSD